MTSPDDARTRPVPGLNEDGGCTCHTSSSSPMNRREEWRARTHGIPHLFHHVPVRGILLLFYNLMFTPSLSHASMGGFTRHPTCSNGHVLGGVPGLNTQVCKRGPMLCKLVHPWERRFPLHMSTMPGHRELTLFQQEVKVPCHRQFSSLVVHVNGFHRFIEDKSNRAGYRVYPA